MKYNTYTTKPAPTVKIVGAGPGDADLLTIKAYKAIKNAKAILYDALIGKEILDFANPEATLVYVGKRANNHSYTQEEINQLMVDYAYNYGNVVRLKGGDPYIFGRGHEEYNYVTSFGIDVEVIPGISSAIAVPELSNIPLTKRGISESFWVLTATNRKGELSKDLLQAVKSDATIVVLMGVGKLNKIVELYQQNGKQELPVAIIQNGSLKTSKTVVGSVNTIAEIAIANKIGTPGIIVLGEVVNTNPAFILEKIRYENK
ncbi:MAG: uroporphyrinogen-III C-methyltransferase [Flavobacteriales bacterium]|nr:MAG: uroporphyrinogen-III C-methyltransferase [Flavobacteriales bacterium]